MKYDPERTICATDIMTYELKVRRFGVSITRKKKLELHFLLHLILKIRYRKNKKILPLGSRTTEQSSAVKKIIKTGALKNLKP